MITKEQASAHTMFYHVSIRNADGTAARCRANGKLKTWKKRPFDWQLPVKHGLKQCFYLSNANAADWLVYDPTAVAKLATAVGLAADVPLGIMADRLEDIGHSEAGHIRHLASL